MRHYRAQDDRKRMMLREGALTRIRAELSDPRFKAEVGAALGFDVEMDSKKIMKSTVADSGDFRTTFDAVDDAGKHRGIKLDARVSGMLPGLE